MADPIIVSPVGAFQTRGNVMVRQISGLLVAVPLAACSPMSSQGAGANLAACERWDVQDVVGKETRSIILKASARELQVQAMFGLLDVDQVVQAFEGATVTFTNVAVTHDALGSGVGSTIGCSANMRIDMSNATAGQDVVQIARLRWVIDFNSTQADPATSDFSVEVDPTSFADGMRINGKAVEMQPPEPEQEETAGPSEAQASAESAAAAAFEAASDAAAAAEAAAEAEKAQDEVAPDGAKSSSTDAPAPTDEDLYAPHI